MSVLGFLDVAVQTKKELDDFKQFIPLIQTLRSPGMKDRHWEELSKQIGFEFRPDSDMTLTKIIGELNMQKHIDIIMKVGLWLASLSLSLLFAVTLT